MHSKRSSSNNLQHRENTDGDHQAETKKRFVAAEAHCTATRPICVHYLGGSPNGKSQFVASEPSQFE